MIETTPRMTDRRLSKLRVFKIMHPRNTDPVLSHLVIKKRQNLKNEAILFHVEIMHNA